MSGLSFIEKMKYFLLTTHLPVNVSWRLAMCAPLSGPFPPSLPPLLHVSDSFVQRPSCPVMAAARPRLWTLPQKFWTHSHRMTLCPQPPEENVCCSPYLTPEHRRTASGTASLRFAPSADDHMHTNPPLPRRVSPRQGHLCSRLLSRRHTKGCYWQRLAATPAPMTLLVPNSCGGDRGRYSPS